MPIVRFCALAMLLLPVIPTAANAQLAVLCSVTSSPMSYGNYDGSLANPTISSATVSISCTALALPTTVTFRISLIGGTGGQAARQLPSGTERLNHQIYTDASRTIVFGDGTGGTAQLTGSGTANLLTPLRRDFTVYGRIAARQRAPRAGIYQDILTVQMTY